MGIKNDKWIKQMAEKYKMIDPFVDHQIREGKISFGLSAYGYDIRIAEEFKVAKASAHDDVLDPKNPRDIVYTGVLGDIVIPPRSYALGRSLEYFKIPRKVMTICQGKSTYARIGVIVNVTPFEPEWEGHATMCIVNTSPMPVVVYANEGIAQLLFFEGDDNPAVSYKDKKGKYQASKGITLSKVDRKNRPSKIEPAQGRAVEHTRKVQESRRGGPIKWKAIPNNRPSQERRSPPTNVPPEEDMEDDLLYMEELEMDVDEYENPRRKPRRDP